MKSVGIRAYNKSTAATQSTKNGVQHKLE
jgi:hypothetical protein